MDEPVGLRRFMIARNMVIVSDHAGMHPMPGARMQEIIPNLFDSILHDFSKSFSLHISAMPTLSRLKLVNRSCF